MPGEQAIESKKQELAKIKDKTRQVCEAVKRVTGLLKSVKDKERQLEEEHRRLIAERQSARQQLGSIDVGGDKVLGTAVRSVIAALDNPALPIPPVAAALDKYVAGLDQQLNDAMNEWAKKGVIDTPAKIERDMVFVSHIHGGSIGFVTNVEDRGPAEAEPDKRLWVHIKFSTGKEAGRTVKIPQAEVRNTRYFKRLKL